VPKRFRNRFIDTFKKHPTTFIGITLSPFFRRIIKTLDRFGLVTIILPVVLLAIILSMVPTYLLWLLIAAIFAHLIISAIRLFKK
jgi:hypothetical protein